MARTMPERFFNHNPYRTQTNSRFTSFHGFSQNRADPEFNKEAQKSKVFHNKLNVLGEELDGLNISLLDQATCKIFIKLIDDLKSMFNSVELLGLPILNQTKLS